MAGTLADLAQQAARLTESVQKQQEAAKATAAQIAAQRPAQGPPEAAPKP